MAKQQPIRQRTSISLDPDVQQALDHHRQYHGDLTRIINTALRQYFRNQGGNATDPNRESLVG